MILVDTSVWFDHLRLGNAGLARLLDGGEAMSHPFIVGELALGNLRRRGEILGAMRELPHVHIATDPEVLHFIDESALFGDGIGYIGAHLLASLRLTPGTRLWTKDRRLHAVAEQLDLAMPA